MEPLRNIAPISVEQYLALDQGMPQGVKLEYFDGYLFCNGYLIDPLSAREEAVAMAGGSPNHNVLAATIGAALVNRLPGNYYVSGSGQQTKFHPLSRYGYPDAVAACDPDFNGVILQNPQLIVEVLSPSTAAYDLGRKFEAYKQWPSVEEIWFVWQDVICVRQHFRTTNDAWSERIYTTLETALVSEHFDLTIPLSEVYQRVRRT
ncbi:MAG: Uma2 family endonuclease [Bacteroidota bacterium]